MPRACNHSSGKKPHRRYPTAGCVSCSRGKAGTYKKRKLWRASRQSHILRFSLLEEEVAQAVLRLHPPSGSQQRQTNFLQKNKTAREFSGRGFRFHIWAYEDAANILFTTKNWDKVDSKLFYLVELLY